MSDLKSKENCCGRYPALWRFTYTHEVNERVFRDGSGDSENTGRVLTVEGQYDVMALNERFANDAYMTQFPARLYALRSGPEFICYVDAVVSFGSP